VPHVLIIVQNLPVPLDRRVWLECQALVVAGYRVSVVCPKGPGDPDYAEIDGVRIFKYPPAPRAHGLLGYALEFGYCWLRTNLIVRRVWRRNRFDAIQACNPPDTYWALARRYRRRGVRFVYDQHDLNPEVFRSRFGEPSGLVSRLQYRALLWLERRTYATAEQVIATNESYRAVAIGRGGKRPEDVTVVRSGPDTSVMRPVDGDPALRRGRAHLAAWLGVMGPQDGVDIVLQALSVLVHQMGRQDLQVALLGFGDCQEELVALTAALGLTEYVTFTGRADPRMVTEYLSAADVGLSPDPLNPLNDVSTMNKTMEYMAFALPVVAFDLTETRVSGGDAAVYVEPNDVERYAKAIADLLDDPDRRVEMAVAARARAETELDWAPSRRRYVGVYDRMLALPDRADPGARPRPDHRGSPGSLPERADPPAPAADEAVPAADRAVPAADETVPAAVSPPPTTSTGTDQWGHRLVDLHDPEALRRFARDRRIDGSG
jgi:glycosyltransferase involved in cell wall biosynthesis